MDQLVVVQDCQATLTPTMRGNYTPRILAYGRYAAGTDKPFVMISPTGENTHHEIVQAMAAQGVPVLRGMRAGMVALRNFGLLADRRPEEWRVPAANPGPFAAEIAGHSGPLPSDLCQRILQAYGIPMVRSALVASVSEALDAALRIGFPLVAKIASPDVPHRSDVGGVELGIADADALRTSLDGMRRRVLQALPNARIDGFELQEEMTDCVEAAIGFIAAPPFGALCMIGSGGVLVELEADRALGLSPISPGQAAALIGRTRLGRRLSGYRRLLPPTDTRHLAEILANVSRMATDLCGAIEACDLNPVLIRKGSGQARVADVLLLARATA